MKKIILCLVISILVPMCFGLSAKSENFGNKNLYIKNLRNCKYYKYKYDINVKGDIIQNTEIILGKNDGYCRVARSMVSNGKSDGMICELTPDELSKYADNTANPDAGGSGYIQKKCDAYVLKNGDWVRENNTIQYLMIAK